MKLAFSKMHGLGNDFVIINNLELRHAFSADEISYLADRKFGIGCDQLLLIDPASDGVSDFFYRIYNSDGSIAGQCGNGARCFIRYVLERGLTDKTVIQLQTLGRVITGQRLADGEIEVNMGIPDFTPESLPFKHESAAEYEVDFNGETVQFAALSMGNPHVVIALDNLESLADENYLARLGEHLQASELFPESVNVNFIYKISDNQLGLRTYERGCGFTLACGSGACASAAVALRAGLVEAPVQVFMPGGELTLRYVGTNLLMRGSATLVFDGEIEL